MGFWAELVMRALFTYSMLFVIAAAVLAFVSLAEEMLKTARRRP